MKKEKRRTKQEEESKKAMVDQKRGGGRGGGRGGSSRGGGGRGNSGGSRGRGGGRGRGGKGKVTNLSDRQIEELEAEKKKLRLPLNRAFSYVRERGESGGKGAVKEIPDISPYWVVKLPSYNKFIPFLPFSSSHPHQIPALETTNRLLTDLLSQPAHIFWSWVRNDTTFLSFFDSFLRFCPRMYGVEGGEEEWAVGKGKEELGGVYEKVFRVVVRLGTRKEVWSFFCFLFFVFCFLFFVFCFFVFCFFLFLFLINPSLSSPFFFPGRIRALRP